MEGGYSSEPVKVENGEGYYNLYATSNRASLTKGYSDSDLPMYLVTIKSVKLDGSKETGQTKIKKIEAGKKVFFPALVMSCGKIGEIVSFKWCVEN